MPPWDESKMRYVGQWFTYTVNYDKNGHRSGPADTYAGAAKQIDSVINNLRLHKSSIQLATITECLDSDIIKTDTYYENCQRKKKQRKGFEQGRLFSQEQLASMKKRRTL